MADFTPNYNLKKPLRTEYYNVADANGNSDIVDTQLKAVNDRVGLVEGEVDALELGKVDKVVGKQLSDENYTLPEKNKVANLPDDTNAQLAEKAQNFKIKNEIVNGDFSQGTTGLLLHGGTATVVDGKLKLNCVSLPTRFGWLCDFKAGEKIYIRIADLQVTNPSKLTNITLTTGSTISVIVESLVPNILPNTKYSAVVTPSLDASVLRFNVTGPDVSEDIDLSLDGIMAIKIGAIFGAGNEPTKLEMDELVKVVPNGWWNGELTLTQKQFITWQLNLIRKNTNAIIALGGTIV